MASSSPNRASSYRDTPAARLAGAARALLSPGIVAAFLAVTSAHAVPAMGADRADPTDSTAVGAQDPLLLALQLPNIHMDAVIPAYERGERVLVPLGELCRALDVAIEVDPANGAATGFFVSEDRRFHLDARARQIVCGKRTFAWDSTGIVVGPDDIYVATGLFASWFDLGLTVRRQAAMLEVQSAVPLPIQAREERARRIEQALAGSDPDYSGFGRVRTPYRPWSTPFVDQELRTWTDAGGGRRQSRWESTTYAAGDLLYMSSDLYVRGERGNPLAEVHGGAGRRDPDPVLLGPLHAREFRAGEVSYPGLALVSRPIAAPGFMVSNFPLERPTQFGEQSFRGRLPSGWDVELYRDDALIAYQDSRPDGTYEFEGVPLLFGLNEFRLVLNGPHGERHEERHSYNVAPTLTPAGTLHYRLVAGGLTDSTLRAHLETDFHLKGSVSGSFALASVKLDDRPRYYASAGMRGYWRHFYAGADAAMDSAGRQVVELALQGRLRRVAASLRHDRLSSGFESDVFRSSFGRIESRTSALLDGQLAPNRGLRVPVQVELTSERGSGGRSVLTWIDRVGFGLGRVSLGYQTHRILTRSDGVGPDRLTQDELLGSMRVRRWSLHGTVNGLFAGHGGMRSTNIDADGPAFGDVYAGLGLAHLAGATHMSAELRTDQGLIGWNARVEAGTRSPLSLSLALTVGLDHEPRHGDWHAGARPVTNTGAASAQVFLDANDNGARDAGEEPLAGVQLMVNHATTEGKTDGRGVLFLGGLPGQQAVDLELATNSLEDPLWIARERGLRVVTRSGRTALVDFPVVISGEVAGTVSVKRAEGPQPASGVTLELVDAASGKIVQRIATAYDGYFDLLAVPPGRYQLRVAASQLRRLGIAAALSRPIEITPTGSLLEGMDLLIQPEPVAGEGAGR